MVSQASETGQPEVQSARCATSGARHTPPTIRSSGERIVGNLVRAYAELDGAEPSARDATSALSAPSFTGWLFLAT